MRIRVAAFLILAQSLLLSGCSDEPPATATVEPEPKVQAAVTPPAETPDPVIEIRAVGKTFEGPAEIPSGWTTFRFVNSSSMIHFGMLDHPPPGITLADMEPLMQSFQDAMDAMNANDEEALSAAFAAFPEWIGELGRQGGPGMLSPGRTGQATVFLEPGYYVMECYVKSDGVFHTTSPGPGQVGMLLPITVTEARSPVEEPVPTATLAIRNSGFEITAGALQPGENMIRVDFLEQQALPSFVGNDVHLMRVDSADSIALADGWLDWRTPNGLEDPAPVTFLGGLNDMPAGSHGYFSVNLEAGDYAFIAEIPGPAAAGFVLPFSVVAAD